MAGSAIVLLAFLCFELHASLSLPQFVFASWPFNSSTQLNDVAGCNLHGYIKSNSSIVYDTGPDGQPNGSVVVGAANSNENYIVISYPDQLKAGNSSWTISLFVNTKGKKGPIVEYDQPPDTHLGAHIWYWSDAPDHPGLWFNPAGHSSTRQFHHPCDFSGWQFIAISYDNATNEYRMHCNKSQIGSLPDGGVAETSSGIIRIGRRIVFSQESLLDWRISCLNIYHIPLTRCELNKVRSSCLNEAVMPECKPDLIGYWPLNAKSGTADISGQQLNGMYGPTGQPQYGIGPNGAEGGSLLFGGKNNVAMNYPDKLNLGSSSWTISLFVNNAGGADGSFISYSSNSTVGYGLHIWQFGGRNAAWLNVMIDGKMSYSEARGTCELSNWQFLAASYDATTGKYQFYCDLTPMPYNGTIIGKTGIADTSSGNFRLGNRQIRGSVDGQLTGGCLSCLVIHKEALNPTQLASVKSKCLGGGEIVYSFNCTAPLQPIGYWPFTAQYNLNDTSGNNLHGKWANSSSSPQFDAGPNGIADGSVVTGPSENDYVHLEGNSFMLGSSSWTLALFRNSLEQTVSLPILEYEEPMSVSYEQFHIWANYPTPDQLYVGTAAKSGPFWVPCDMKCWQFVAISYDAKLGHMGLFCNNRYPLSAFSTPPVTTSSGRFNLGKRIRESTKRSLVACFSIYPKALGEMELLEVKRQCLSGNEAIVNSSATASTSTTSTQGYSSTTSNSDIANFGTTPPFVYSSEDEEEFDEQIKSITPKRWTEMTTQRIVRECSDLSPINRSPPLYKRKPLDTIIRFSIDRLVSINNIKQSVSVIGQLYTKWKVSTCLSKKTGAEIREPERVMVANVNKIWHPKISFRNSVGDISMKGSLYYNRMEFVFKQSPTEPDYRDIYFFWKKRGLFTTSCKFDLEAFPFDSQQCDFTFMLLEPIHLVNISVASFAINPKMSTTSEWRIANDGRAIVTQVVLDGQHKVGQATFAVTLKRRPDFYLFNLLGPSLALTFMSFSTFFIPPQNTDRATFNVYLVLALQVSLVQVQFKVPVTGDSNLLNSYIEMLALICLWITCHSIAMILAISRYPEKMLPGSMLRNLFDIAGYSVALAAFIAITCVAARNATLI